MGGELWEQILFGWNRPCDQEHAEGRRGQLPLQGGEDDDDGDDDEDDVDVDGGCDGDDGEGHQEHAEGRRGQLPLQGLLNPFITEGNLWTSMGIF